MNNPTPRRHFMGLMAAAVPAAGLVIGGRPAAAFQVLPFEDYRALVEQACRPAEEHARLLAAARQQLPAAISPAEAERWLRSLTCPTCGCPLAAAVEAPIGK